MNFVLHFYAFFMFYIYYFYILFIFSHMLHNCFCVASFFSDPFGDGTPHPTFQTRWPPSAAPSPGSTAATSAAASSAPPPSPSTSSRASNCAARSGSAPHRGWGRGNHCPTIGRLPAFPPPRRVAESNPICKYCRRHRRRCYFLYYYPTFSHLSHENFSWEQENQRNRRDSVFSFWRL